MAMRYAAMQWLTWGTIAASVGCALWLAGPDGVGRKAEFDIAAGLPRLLQSTPQRAEPALAARPAAAASVGRTAAGSR